MMQGWQELPGELFGHHQDLASLAISSDIVCPSTQTVQASELTVPALEPICNLGPIRVGLWGRVSGERVETTHSLAPSFTHICGSSPTDHARC